MFETLRFDTAAVTMNEHKVRFSFQLVHKRSIMILCNVIQRIKAGASAKINHIFGAFARQTKFLFACFACGAHEKFFPLTTKSKAQNRHVLGWHGDRGKTGARFVAEEKRVSHVTDVVAKSAPALLSWTQPNVVRGSVRRGFALAWSVW